MATAADCIKLALRKLRVIGQGASPSSAQQADALLELNHMIREWVGNGLSPPYQDVRVDSSVELGVAYPAWRLQCMGGGLTVTLPKGDDPAKPIPDGYRVAIVDVAGAFAGSPVTVNRNGWKIAGATSNATLTAGTSYFFRADAGDFAVVGDMIASDSLPFPTRFDYGIALMLAKRLEGEYGQPLGPADDRAATRARIALYAHYVKPGDVAFETAASRLGGVHWEHGTLQSFLNGYP